MEQNKREGVKAYINLKTYVLNQKGEEINEGYDVYRIYIGDI